MAIGYCAAAERLCVLVVSAAAVLVFPPRANGLGFDRERALTVALPAVVPETAPPLQPGAESGVQPEPPSEETAPGTAACTGGSDLPAAKRARDAD